MDMNPGVTILFAEDGSASIMVNHNGHVWSKKYQSGADAIEDAVEARLVAPDTAKTLLEHRKGYMGPPLHYYPPALRECGFAEFPVLD
jgi:hypothetical protein